MKKTIILILAVFVGVFLPWACGQPSELLVNKGPNAGCMVKITRKDHEPDRHIVSRSQTNSRVLVTIDGGKVSVPVKLAAYRHGVVKVGSDGKERRARVIELEVLSATNTPFRWSCWVSANSQPRDFAVFSTESGKTYACYAGVGVHILLVRGSKDSAVSFQEYWEYVPEERPDALRPLTMGVLFDRFGREPFESKNALYYDVFVDDIFDVSGELRVTLHGNKPEPKYTFALRNDKWELVSN